MKKLLLILAICLWTLDALGATYYVSKTGSNAHGCSTTDSSATNKQTITAGIGCLASGDTLMIHAGTYTEQVIVPTGKSGTSWATATTIGAVAGETVIQNGNFGYLLASSSNYVIFQNFIVDGTLQTPVNGGTLVSAGQSNHLRFLNMEVRNAKGFLAVAFQDSSYIEFIGGSYHDCQDTAASSSGAGYAFYYTPATGGIIDGVHIYNVQDIAITLNLYVPAHPTNYTRNNIIRNCLIHNISRGTIAGHPQTAIGIIVGGGHADLNTVYNNVIYGTGASGGVEEGITIGGGLDNAVYNNTLYNLFGRGIRLNDNGAAVPVTRPLIQNNILDHVGTPIEVLTTTTTPTYSNNMSNVSGTGVSVVENPLFISTSTPDFHLQTTSPAKNAGTTVAAVTTDKDGVTRPQGGSYDIGAYEFSSPDNTPPVISAISASGIADTAANIVWSTNESADSQVQYGTTIGYGTTTTLDSTLVTSHLVALSGLTQATLYHYKVISKDASANSTSSADQTFATSGTPFTSTIAITNPDPGSIFLTGDTQPIIWTTDDPGNLKIEISFNNGSTYLMVTPSIPASQNSYDYTVTPPASSQVLFKISSLSYSGVATLAGVMKVAGNYVK